MSNHLLDLCGIRESLTSLPSDHELDLIIAAYDKAAATPNTLRDLRLDLANWRLRNQAPVEIVAVRPGRNWKVAESEVSRFEQSDRYARSKQHQIWSAQGAIRAGVVAATA